MLFNSFNFLLFFVATVTVFFIIPKRLQWVWILLASCFFYYINSGLSLILLLVIVVLNYLCALVIQKTTGKKKYWIYVFSVVTNILILCFFKYSGFLSDISDSNSANGDSFFSGVIMPLGISYIIFSLISYLIEVKRGSINAETNPGRFAAAYMFFPKIAQGPIERPANILWQFSSPKSFDSTDVIEGLKLMVWGFFKKLVIADRLAVYVNAVYGNYEHHSGISLLLATLFYSFQIYADFSGYTDIALGSARIMGFRLSPNFNRPYLSKSIKEFWTKWHISFSTWLRDYLFLPLAINLTKRLKKEKYMFIASDRLVYVFAIVLTFAICGIWHGEGLNYLIWGLFFGVAQSVANLTDKMNKRFYKRFNLSKKAPAISALNITITFLLVSFSWIFFRSENTSMAFDIISSIANFQGSLFIEKPTDIIFSFFGIIVLVAVELWQEYKTGSSLPYGGKNWFVEQIIYAVMIILIVMIGVLDGGQFIYFQY